MRPERVMVGEAAKSRRRDGDATKIFVSQSIGLDTNLENLVP